MCGFIGSLSRNLQPKNKYLSILQKSRYRGPSNTSCKFYSIESVDKSLMLGFNRLAIQDLSKDANQPLEKYNFSIVFNGEIYNKKELFALLGNVELKTSSDTEVILELYNKYSEKFVNFLNGMFSIVIFDKKKKRLIMCRDRFGIKPFYYSLKNEDIFFSSEIRGVYELLKQNNTVIFNNKDYFIKNLLLDPFLAYGDTPFQNIHTFPKGTIAFFDILTSEFSIKKYYDFTMVKKEYDKDYNLPEIFKNVVNRHLISDVPISCSLSGGFDSSLISYHLLKDKIKATFFTLDLKEKNGIFSKDIDFAKQLYECMKNENSEMVFVKAESFWNIKLIDEIVLSLGTPIYEERLLILYNLYRSAREKNISVLLNGQGADELWYGYYPNIWNWFSNIYHKELNDKTIRSYLIKRTKEAVFANCMAFNVKKELDKYSSDLYYKIISVSNEFSKNEKISLFLIDNALECFMKFEDNVSMIHSVEARVPFLDNELAEIALKLPERKHLLNRENENVKGKDYIKDQFKNIKELSPIVNRQKNPLPKLKQNDADLIKLFYENFESLKNSKLINSIFDVNKIKKSIETKNTNFYGGLNDFLVQIISLWRFEVLFVGE